MKVTQKSLFYSLLITMIWGFQSCSIYTFSGVNTNATTIFVNNFLNKSGGGPPSLAQDFTERLKEYYQRNSKLKIANSQEQGDIVLEGNIVRYNVQPIAATGLDQASQNRLNIGVQVDFKDATDDSKNFEARSFSFYADFPANQTLSQVENELIELIFEQISLDIFNETVATW